MPAVKNPKVPSLPWSSMSWTDLIPFLSGQSGFSSQLEPVNPVHWKETTVKLDKLTENLRTKFSKQQGVGRGFAVVQLMVSELSHLFIYYIFPGMFKH